MSWVKIDFLNWQPDQEDWNNEGLVTADNVIHSEEGYVPFSNFNTGSYVASTTFGTAPSIIFRPVGTNDQQLVAWLDNATAAGAGFTIDLNIGMTDSRYSGLGTYTTYTSSTITSAWTGNNIAAFDVCELDDKIFWAVQAELPTATVLNASAPVITINSTGYATI